MIETGMNAATGRALSEMEHLRQSIATILMTPIGTRVMRREFGSIVPDLIDAPINDRTRLLLMAATATAIIRWEPRVRPAKISLTFGDRPERLVAELTAAVRSGPLAGQTVTMAFPLGL